MYVCIYIYLFTFPNPQLYPQHQDGSLRLFLSYSTNFDWKKSGPRPAGSGYQWTLQEVILRSALHPIPETTVV